jgi:hypothetical protein
MDAWLAQLDRKAVAALGWLAVRPRWAAAFLVALCLVVNLPGIAALPVTDRDEARFAQASKQMVETGRPALQEADRRLFAAGGQREGVRPGRA